MSLIGSKSSESISGEQQPSMKLSIIQWDATGSVPSASQICSHTVTSNLSTIHKTSILQPAPRGKSLSNLQRCASLTQLNQLFCQVRQLFDKQLACFKLLSNHKHLNRYPNSVCYLSVYDEGSLPVWPEPKTDVCAIVLR